MIPNNFVPNIGAPKYIKQILIELLGERLQYSKNEGLQHTTFSNGQITETEDQ
jgi:hypothetical protein